MNLPGTIVSAPTLTDKDREDLRFGVAQGVDYIALSFVRGAEDIIAAKQLIADCGGDVPVIAKIERQEAVTELEAILAHADGVMVARGDLGVELGPEAVPVLQKRIIADRQSPSSAGDYRDANAGVDDATRGRPGPKPRMWPMPCLMGPTPSCSRPKRRSGTIRLKWCK